YWNVDLSNMKDTEINLKVGVVIHSKSR
ncbi:uncharacterized protein METZ01_LOCUS372549, partial [marine metagenome]